VEGRRTTCAEAHAHAWHSCVRPATTLIFRQPLPRTLTLTAARSRLGLEDLSSRSAVNVHMHAARRNYQCLLAYQ